MKSSATILCSTVALMLVAASSAWAGQFKAAYSEVTDKEFKEWEAELKADKVLETLASDLNAELAIPTDVWITVGECGTENAFYNPEEQAIILCYELIREIYYGALEEGWSEEQAELATMNAIDFFFYHELGHALIHVLDLPATGREEDAVDQLSVYALAYMYPDGEVPALDAATAFLYWAQEAKEVNAQAAYWDEHSLNEQRFFNIVCWVYGQDPQRFQKLVQGGSLPEDRAARCPAEWAQIDKSWSVLLASSLKGE